MTKTIKKSDIQNDVMKQINSGSVSMKPRIYFTLLWLAGIVAAILAAISVAYLISMASYMIRIQTASTPAYGARQNLSQAVSTFPWWAVIVSAGLVFGSIWLMRKYSRIYRYNVVAVVLVFMVISILLGIGLSYTGIGHTKGRSENSGSQYEPGSGRGRNLSPQR